MKHRIKVKKYIITHQRKQHEVLVPYLSRDSLWIGVPESEDGNGIIGTYRGLQDFLNSLAVASRNPYSIIYLPIKNFLVPDVKDLANQVLYGKDCLLDIVIVSTKANLRIHDWKTIRNKIKLAPFKNIDIHYHYENPNDLERYQIDRIIHGAFNDIKTGTFFIIYPQPYLTHLANQIHEWIEELKEDKNYTLEYNDKYDSFTFYDFFTNVWTFRLSKHYRSPSKFMTGFYLDCWDIAVMQRQLRRKINLITWQEAKLKGESKWQNM